MKNLLNYQTSEYDCGPVSILNGIRYLFEREDIYPDLVKFIMLYCMDLYNETGEPCKHGTSPAAMSYITCWLNHFAQIKKFPLRCERYSGEEVTLTPGSPIVSALENGGVVVLHLFLDVAHYVLLTGIDEEKVYLFDPYYEDPSDPNLEKEYAPADEISFIWDQPRRANRSVSIERISRFTREYYEMGEFSWREAMVMFHTDQTEK